MKTSGQAAYEKWLTLLIPTRIATPGFNWTQIPPSAREAWEEIAQTAIAEYKQLNVVVADNTDVHEHCRENLTEARTKSWPSR